MVSLLVFGLIYDRGFTMSTNLLKNSSRCLMGSTLHSQRSSHRRIFAHGFFNFWNFFNPINILALGRGRQGGLKTYRIADQTRFVIIEFGNHEEETDRGWIDGWFGQFDCACQLPFLPT